MKRWYQLSMLQLLVAMGLACLACVLNIEVEQPPIYWDFSGGRSETELKFFASGWPFNYMQSVVEIDTSNQAAIKREYLFFKARWEMLVVDIAFCMFIVIAFTAFVGVLSRGQKSCPSTST